MDSSIGVSEDVASSKIPSSYLENKLITALPPGNVDVEQKAISAICKALADSQRPILLVDGGAARSSWEKFVPELVDTLRIPVLTTTLGKGIVDESSPYYMGGYDGVGSLPGVTEIVEAADCVLWLGGLPSDFNTQVPPHGVARISFPADAQLALSLAFTFHISSSATVIDFQRLFVQVGCRIL